MSYFNNIVCFQVPVECKPERQHFKAMKFLIDTANDKERTVHFPEVLSRELIAAMENVVSTSGSAAVFLLAQSVLGVEGYKQVSSCIP